MEDDPPKEGEVIPPEKTGQDVSGDEVNVYAQIINSISHYTNRPDLLLGVIEKHDPGFIQRMTASAQGYSEKLRSERFYFGKWQAYVSLALRSIAALVILAAGFYSIYANFASFPLVVALAIFYAVTQSGTSGFSRLTQAISNLIERYRTGGR